MDIPEAEVPTTDVEAPTADQPDVSTTPEAPEAVAPGTSEPETPEADAPEGEESFTDDSDVPEELRERHSQMQADYTRKTQALAERHAELDQAVTFVSDLVSDEPNATQEAVFRTLAERLGYEFDEDDTPAETETETDEATPEFRDPRLDPIIAEREAEKAAKADAEHREYLAQQETAITDGISALAKTDGIELTDEEMDIIFDGVLALPAHEGGPALQQAYDRYKAATKAHTDRWVKSKKTAQAPGGSGAEEPVDFSNEEARLAYTARAVEAAQRAQAGL